MKSLNLPLSSLRIKEGSDNQLVYDPLRRKYVVLTPEEWVRQHFAGYLINSLGYPPGLITIEAAFRLNTMLRRADILVHDRHGQPALIVECKAPEVKITQEVFDQVINYNFNYGLKYLVVTNGLTHFAAEINSAERCFILLDHIPDYEYITRPVQ